jgi:hypothetical protein
MVTKSDAPNNEIGCNKDIVPFCSNNTSEGRGDKTGTKM